MPEYMSQAGKKSVQNDYKCISQAFDDKFYGASFTRVRFKIGAIAPSRRLKSGSGEVRGLKDGLRRPFVLEGVGPPSAQSAPRA